ncbi:MAG: alpha/beta hydrolase [Zoogloeaceae bacterium]|nr:alpha/beta hydrolase [Zoogloeaceae bacterium]MCK6384983.1 GPI inositol-deacylase [Rhodocyclaceae bacterium]
MTRKAHLHAGDLHGFGRLAIDAVAGLTDLVEAMHHNISSVPAPLGKSPPGRTRGITGFVYGSIRGVTRLVGGGLDAVLGRLVPLFGERPSSPEREAVLAALNGVLGDYLEASSNPLAIPMRFRRAGRALTLDKPSLAAAFPRAGSRLLVLAHGLCMSDLQWQRQGHDHGAALARDLGYTPVCLHYNSGRHISTNGREFAGLLDALVANWPVPVERLDILGHSMGGLLARSAWHYGTAAGHAWPRRLKTLVFLGTPHHGAPLERGGNWIDVALGASPYTAPLSRLGKIRSAGITDLRHAWLVDGDWQGRDRFARSRGHHQALPLSEGVACHAIAATTGEQAGDLKDRLIGDGLVPLASALGCHDEAGRKLMFAPERQWISCETGHLDLLSRPEVYARLRQWLETA